MRLTLLYIFILGFGYSQAQNSVFKAKFKSLQNGQPILYAKVYTGDQEVKLTNIDGYVEIEYEPNAKIIISHLTYDTLVLETEDWKNQKDLEFYLTPKIYELREVTFSILGRRSLFDNKFVNNDIGKSDEEKVKEKLAVLGLKNELISLDQAAQDGYVLGSPISYLYERFSKSGKDRRLYAELLEKDRQKKISRKQFDDITVTTLTNFTDEELKKFKDFCSFHPNYLQLVDALTLYYEIIRCKNEYEAKGMNVETQ